MCGLLFAVDPTQKTIPRNQVGSADDLAGQLPGADGTAQGVLADIDAGGVGTLHGLLNCHFSVIYQLGAARRTVGGCLANDVWRIACTAVLCGRYFFNHLHPYRGVQLAGRAYESMAWNWQSNRHQRGNDSLCPV